MAFLFSGLFIWTWATWGDGSSSFRCSKEEVEKEEEEEEEKNRRNKLCCCPHAAMVKIMCI